MYLKLIRQPAQGKAVRGTLYSVRFTEPTDGCLREHLTPICTTLENLDYLITPLIYPVRVTHSPKFDRLLPLVSNVPGRSGLRIHPGTRPEHSRGCILVDSWRTCTALTQQLLDLQRIGEEIRIEIA